MTKAGTRDEGIGTRNASKWERWFEGELRLQRAYWHIAQAFRADAPQAECFGNIEARVRISGLLSKIWEEREAALHDGQVVAR